MNSPNLAGLEDKTFLVLIVAVTLAFAWILWPFYGSVFWGTVLAILFAPPYRRLLTSMGQRRTLAALVTVLIVLMIVILPLTLISALLLQEGFSVYERIQSGELNIGQYFQQVFGALPAWVTDLLDRFGLTNLGLMQERLSNSLMKGSQFLAAQALSIGQNTFDLIVNLFIVLYLLFFLLRDGDDLYQAHQKCDAVALGATARALEQVHHRHPRNGQRQCRRGHRARSARRPDLLVFGSPRPGVMGGADGFSIAAPGGREPP